MECTCERKKTIGIETLDDGSKRISEQCLNCKAKSSWVGTVYVFQKNEPKPNVVEYEIKDNPTGKTRRKIRNFFHE